jgi:predicted TIM-barrel fold metal-dependent hydrolase
MNRRQFLRQGACALAAAGLGRLAFAPAAEAKDNARMPPIIDTHQHLWDLHQFKLPWVEEGSILARNYTMQDYLKATAGLNVVKTIYMEVDVAPEQETAEAEHVSGICAKGKTPMVKAVISGRPALDGFKKYIEQFKDNKYIRGIREVIHNARTPAGYCLQEKFIKGIQLLGELGLTFDICIRPQELMDAAKLIDACPDTHFILDHCGNAKVPEKNRTRWQRGMAAVAERKHVVCKVSGIVASAKPGEWTADDLAPIVNHTVEVFGKDRVMFGGDWPVCTLGATYKQWVEALKSIVHDWKEEDQRKLFHDNAVRVYGLA